MADEKTPKHPKKSIAAQKRWDREHAKTEQQKDADADLKEARIEEIAALMRRFADKQGQLLWTRKRRLEMGKAWGLTDLEVRRLSAEASKRVCEEVDDPESQRRNVGTVMTDQLARAHAMRNVKDAVAVSMVILKMAERSQSLQVTVEVKQPTAADATAAAREIFGNNDVTNAAKPADPIHLDAGETKPSDGAEAPGSTPKE